MHNSFIDALNFELMYVVLWAKISNCVYSYFHTFVKSSLLMKKAV